MNANNNQPDFAYPETVAKDARAQLKNALKTGNGPSTLNALIKYGIARTQVSSDNFPEVVQQITQIADTEKNPQCRAMLRLLLADAFNSYYESDSYNLDERTTVEGETDFTLWSGEQLRVKIAELIGLALSERDALVATPISDYAEDIEYNEVSALFYPTLYDFACSKSIAILQDIDNPIDLMPIGSPYSPFKGVTGKKMSSELVESIADSWVEANPEPNAARICAVIKRATLDANPYRSADYDEMMQLFNENASNPYRIEIILQMYRNASYGSMTDEELEQTKTVYRELTTFASQHPDYVRIADVRTLIGELSYPTASVNVERRVARNVPFEITVRSTNTKSLNIYIYRLREGMSTRNLRAAIEPKPYKVIPVEFDAEVPFSQTVKVEAEINDYGCYAVVINVKDDIYNYLICSDLTAVSNKLGEDASVWVLDVMSGKPVEGATVEFYKSGRNEALVSKAVSNKDGRVALPENQTDLYYLVKKGDDRFSAREYLSLNQLVKNTLTTAYIKTDLPVYRPGDRVSFVSIVYEYQGDTHKPLANKDFEMVVLDVNNQPVETLEVTTDEFGRTSGSFVLPESGLTGYYTLRLQPVDGNSANLRYYRGIATKDFMVSDYKLPTFEITLDRPTAVDGDMIIGGKAMTYSGFPVQDATVAVSLEESPLDYRFFFRASQEALTDTITTDQNGRFALKLTPEKLATFPFADGFVTAKFIVTSAAGESHGDATSFLVGRKTAVNGSFANPTVAQKETKLNLRVNNFANEPIDARLVLEFKLGDEITTIECQTADGKAVADLSTLPSGTYEVTVTAPETDALPLKLSSVVVYNSASANSPVNNPLWVLQRSVILAPDKSETEITYATANPDTYILLTVSTPDRVVERRWVVAKKAGVGSLKVTMPKDSERATVTLMALRNMETSICEVELAVENPANELKIKVERLRDKVTPLTRETLSITVADGSERGVRSGVILDMYAKSLDAIEYSPFAFNPLSGRLPRLSSSTFSNSNFSVSIGNYFSGSVSMIEAPDFNYYGEGGLYESYSRYVCYDTCEMPMRSMKSASVAEAGMMYDEAVEDFAAVKEVASNGVATEAESETQPETEAYRPSEIALAFFEPMLTTDENGRLSYTFTVPNANTTWALNMLALTPDVIVANKAAEIISQKPIMVEPNLPRFVREGDSVVILASVMNASEADASVTTRFEILNPVDMTVVSSGDFVSDIPAGSSVVESFPLTVDDTLPALMVRVKSTADNYTDGVQALLPVLPNTQQVMDSHTFYLAPDQLEFSMPVGDAKGTDAVTIVSFCENPTWEVVSALPGLRSEDIKTSLGASAHIFAAATSQFVLDRNPDIAPALSEWLASAKEEDTLLSMLSRNEDLKQLVLASTPWVQAAESDNERLSRLALLFAPGEIESATKRAVEVLQKLEANGGGWCWTSDYNEPSEWVTLEILNNFAELRQLGCYPAELDPMVKRALTFVDKKISKDYDRFKGSDYYFYTYVRTLYPEVAISGSARTAYNQTLTSMRKNWKKFSTAQKAAIALTLYRTGNQLEAKKILASVREFAQSTPELGMWWDSVEGSSFLSLARTGQTAFILEAFNTIEPGCKEVDMIRQWLILNKVVQDWGTSVNASACVAAILGCGSNWLYKPGDVAISVGGTEIHPTDIDRLTGAFHIDVANPTGNLEISRHNEGPAWGAVLNRSTRVMTDVEAASLPELSIVKQILVNNDGKWVDADSLAVGQTVKIRLIINTMRDMDYITVVDNRSATMEPVVQTPRPVYCDGLVFYLENRDSATNLFISRLPKGQYIIEYEMFVNNAGAFSSGIATIQSQYTPEMTAHSAGRLLKVAQ